MLTELKCRAAKAREKPHKLADSKGLYLFVTRAGYRSWRWKYRWGGKERTLVLGPYPEIGLAAARDHRDEARRRLREGIDPAAAKKRPAAGAGAAAGPTFEAYARAWHADQAPLWKPGHAAQLLARLEANVFPAIGAIPIAEVKPADVKTLLLATQERGAVDAAHRIRGNLSAIFGRAIADELVESDPAAAVAAVLKPVRARRYPAIVDLERARAFLRAVEAQPAQPATKLASRLLALTAVRPGVVRLTPRTGEFREIEGEQALWHIPASRMKLGLDESERDAFDFLVPLSRQAAETVRVAQAHAGRAPWLFPGLRSAHRPMSDNGMLKLYKRMPAPLGRHVPHGWRSTFSSVMNERSAQLGRPGDADVIELMLAHKPQGVRGIYNRAAYLQRRRELAQLWADLLLKDMPPAEALLEGPRH